MRSFIRARILAGLALGLSQCACTQAATAPDTIAAFDRIGANAFAQQHTPGFVFAVVKDGKLAYVRGFGLGDVANRAPVTPKTRFAIGSLTKQFTAASIMMLARRRRIDLDDPLANYLPAFPNAANITLRELADQTSGVHNYPLLKEHPWPLSGPVPLDKIVSFLALDKPDFAPNTQYAYSNSNYALLSSVIAKAGDMDEATFLLRNVFEPLKMHDSGYGTAEQERPGLALPYAGREKYELQSPIGLDLFAGAGAIVSTAVDMSAWDIALLNGSLLDKSETDELWRPGRLSDGSQSPYAMGFFPATLAGHREVWHNGLAPGAGGYCYNALFPDDKLAVIVLSNGSDFQGIPETMAESVLAHYDPQAQADVVPVAAPSPAEGENPEATARAKDWLERLRTGTVDLDRVTPAFAARLTPTMLGDVKTSLATAGNATDWVYLGSRGVADAVIYRYWIRLGGVPHVWSVGLTQDGHIAGSLLK